MEYIRSRLLLHLRVFWLMGSVRARLVPLGLEKTVRWAGEREPSPASAQHPPERVVRAVQRAGRVIPGSSCLVQSLTLLSVLRSQGRDARLVIGCGKTAGQWAAHAWVESGGKAYQPVYATSQTELARCTAAQNWRLDRAPLPG